MTNFGVVGVFASQISSFSQLFDKKQIINNKSVFFIKYLIIIKKNDLIY
jgi:hypothetical protein